MSRRGLHDLGQMKAKKGFDPTKFKTRANGKKGFETIPAAIEEDWTRARILRANIKRLDNIVDRNRVKGLAKRLERTTVPDTPASFRRFREFRIALVSHFWSIFESTHHQAQGTATILVKGWKVPSAELHRRNPRKMLESFRADLNRVGLQHASGFALFGLHGEYDPTSDCFDIHIHGIYAGEIGAVIDSLRTRPKYHSFQTMVGQVEKLVRRILVREGPLINLPHPFSYVIQSWWPQRETILNQQSAPRSPTRKRIPDRPFVEWLLWMDRWDITDLTLLIGLRVTKTGLTERKKRTAIATDDD